MTEVGGEKQSPGTGSILFGLLLVAGSSLLAYEAWSIAGFSSFSSAGVFPMLATGTMLLCACFSLAREVRRWRRSGGSVMVALAPAVPSRRLLFFAALVVAYMLVLQPLGFLVASGLFIFACTLFLWRKRIVTSVIVSVLVPIVIYLLFRHVFVVMLPKGTLW